MDTADLFASQWQILQTKRQQLIDEVDQLRCKLNNLSEDSLMRQLLQQRRQLKQKVPELEDKIARLASNEPEKQTATRLLRETTDHLTSIEEHYRVTQRYLKEAIREAEEKRRQLHEDILQWATCDRQHLQWTLNQQVSCQHELIHRFRVRFPNDSLTDLMPRPPAPVHNHQKYRRKKTGVSPGTVPETAAVASQVWRFFIALRADDPGEELLPPKEQFAGTLQAILGTVAYRNLDVRLVYDKLLAVTRMTTQQRQELKQYIAAELRGWKIVRVGSDHRLFLSIDEEKRQIRFMPRPRKESYRRG